jgi:hypothetical protein
MPIPVRDLIRGEWGVGGRVYEFLHDAEVAVAVEAETEVEVWGSSSSGIVPVVVVWNLAL